MIGIDTNVLLRHTLEDDPVQSPRATAFLTDPRRAAEPALLNPVALIEFVWTLARRKKFDKADILDLLDVLTTSPNVRFTDADAVVTAIEDWRAGTAEFQDYLIGHLNRQAGAPTTMTFDKRAAKHPAFSRLAT